VPTLTTLFALVKHSTDTQDHWLRIMMMGERASRSIVWTMWMLTGEWIRMTPCSR
jgi:hypothetical protein